MEFDFSCEQVTKADKYGYSIVDSDKLLSLPKKSYEYIETLVDVMGKYSSKAQRLPSVITSFKKLQMNTDNQRVYFYSKKNKCFGYLKTGNKKLFVSTEFGEIKEINPLCVLDFYVSEEVQRQGIGKKLFDLMLSDSKARPEKLAYDRPSEKLLKFLSKHFGLKRYLPQNNNFVVFSQYFSANFKSKAGGIYESKPSYKVTYDKGERKEYDQTNNIVNQDYITNLITSSQDSNTKIRKMAANEESKNGFNQIHEGAEAHKDNISEFNFQEKTEEEYRKPLVDTTNETRDIDNNYNNPITGLGYKSDKQVIIEKPIPVSPYADVEMKPEESTDPSGPELDRLIERKEKELQECMSRIDTISKGTSNGEIYTEQVPKSSQIEQYNPMPEEPTQKTPLSHGHPSLSDYNATNRGYTASGMRRAQFHSTAPWALSDK